MKDSTKADGRPAFQFYPDDYLRDVAPCSLAAQGLWMAMLCHMWTSPERGRLLVRQVNSENATCMATYMPATWQDVGNMVGKPMAEVQAASADLIRYNVVGIASDGTLYSRRMVREEAERQQKSMAGRCGAHSRWGATAMADDMAKRGSSSSSSTSLTHTRTPDGDALVFSDEDKKTAFEDFKSIYPKGRFVHESRCWKSFVQQIKTSRDYGELAWALREYEKCDRVKRGFVQSSLTFLRSNWRQWLKPDAPKDDAIQKMLDESKNKVRRQA